MTTKSKYHLSNLILRTSSSSKQFRSKYRIWDIGATNESNILNEKGAEVESKVKIAYVKNIRDNWETKNDDINKPFLVFLQGKRQTTLFLYL